MDKDKRTSFTLGDVQGERRFETPVRDKDNAAPRVPPPSMARTPHPRLAPPGSVGIRPSLQTVMDRAPPPARTGGGERRPENAAQRSFKPLVQKSPDKGRTPER